MSDERRRASWPIAVAIVLVVTASFAPTLANDFVDWDDDLNLTGNQHYRGLSWTHLSWMLTTTRGGHWQPLTWLSFALDHAVWGMDARGYHLGNLLLHAANAVLVWLLLRRLLARLAGTSERILPWAAAVGSLWFAVHPLRVESVAWATERRDVLSGCFWLTALLLYLRTAPAPPERRRAGRAGMLVALALSLAAKAWAITFPAVVLILDWYPLRRRALREKIPIVGLAAVAAVIALVAQRSVPEMRSFSDHPLAARIGQAAYGLCFYVAQSLWPFGLQPAHLFTTPLDPTAPRFLLALATVAAVTVLAFRERRRRPWLLATWVAYVAIVAPVLGLAQTGPQLVADRYSYLAGLPLTALATAGLARAWSRSAAAGRAWPVVVASLASIALLGSLTFRQTRIWHDSMTLWNHVLALDPCNWIAYTNRGFARTDPEAALADYDAAIRCNPRWPLAYFNRGNVRHERGDYVGAEGDHATVIALRPDEPDAYNNRGWARQALGDFAGAAADYERALALAPPDWPSRSLVAGNLARARARLAADAP
ncbi:MAG: tetratricopeptide repeat protein [Deltaproteobacteria bacterium]|nr:tetratricopeptide repeat protein [Deltaproteobacteria bacterium]